MKIILLAGMLCFAYCSKVNDPQFADFSGSASAGFIILVNGTEYDWIQIDQSNEGLRAWNFPVNVVKGSSVDVFIDPKSSYSLKDTQAATVTYRLDGLADAEFQIVANSLVKLVLQVDYSGLSALDTPEGSTEILGWNPGAYVSFALSGTPGSFYTNHSDASHWMERGMDWLGNRPLSSLCIIGTHNSGMSIYSSGTALTGKCNTLTQYVGIYEQLKLGARYFDIRPVLKDGIYYTGHYSKIDQAGITSWQGACGQSIDDIIAEVNLFCQDHKELVIMNLSHSLNTDLDKSAYRSFNQDEWIALFDHLEGLEGLFKYPDAAVDLPQLPLSLFINRSSAVVLIIEGFSSLGAYQGNGFFTTDNFSVYNQYANTNQLYTMTEDQLRKMEDHYEADYFLLSWTLTQNNAQATTCFSGTAPSIEDLAIAANQRLASMLFPAVPQSGFPNIVYVDYLADTGLNALVMGLNRKGN